MTRTPIISLGGGVQSSALTLMAAAGEFDPTPPLAVFADPQGELEETYTYVDWLAGEAAALGGAIEVVRTTGGSLEAQLLAAAAGRAKRASNPPLYTWAPTRPEGQLQRGCTRDFKIRVVRRELRRRGYGPKSPVTTWIGYTTDEAERMNSGGENPLWQEVAYPLIERRMSRADCEAWLRERGYPLPPKSACVFCPYRTNAGWRDLQENHPEAFERACSFDDAIRDGLPNVTDAAFIHRDRRPLREVDLGVDQLELGACDGNAGCFT